MSEFRSRLITGHAESLLFETLLTDLKQRGLVKAQGRQRTDATHVLAATRAMNRMVCVGETLSATLHVLAESVPDWLRSFAPEEWHGTNDRRREDSQFPKEKAKRLAYVETIGTDGMALLTAIFTTPQLNWHTPLPAVQILRCVWVQQFEMIEGEVHFSSDDTIAPSAQMICSPYDIQATYGRTLSTWWVGDIGPSDGEL